MGSGSDVEMGRARQRLPLLNPQQWAWLVVGCTIGGLFLLWHLALVITAGVPVGGIGVTLRGIITANPLSLGAKYPADGTAFAVWAVLVVVGVVGVLLVRRWWMGRHRDSPLGFASAEAAQMSAGEARARKKAAWIRRASVARGFDPDTAPLNQVGSLLGFEQGAGEPVVLTLEDQTGIVAPTGAGKGLYLMTGVCVDAPGPLVATSTKPELLDAIVEARTALGRVWVWDPLNMSWWPEPMVWDPTAGADKAEVASARGLAFAGGLQVDNDKDGAFFQKQAGIITARLLRAAAIGGLDMDAVITWAADLKASANRAVQLLKRDPATEHWGTTLATAITGADDTVSSTRMTMAQQIEPLLNPAVMRQLIPAPGVDVFDPVKFVQSTDTLVIITDDQAQTNVAPLSTMLLNEVMDAAKHVAAMAPTGRLDPPLRIGGDEIVNVAPVPKLPGMLSDSRGIGVQWFVVFQSASQILARWGEREGSAIMGNLNCSMVLGGLQDPKALDRWSALAGQVEMQEVTSHVDAHNNVASQRMVTVSERTMLRPEEIRQLPDGVALVIYRNAPPMLVDLVPWTDRPDGDEITDGIQRVREARVAHYRAHP